MKKLFLSFIVAAIAVVSMSAQEPPTKWSGEVKTDWADSYDSQTEFKISSAAELAGLAQLVNEKIHDFVHKTIILEDHINLNANNWVPIGRAAAPFKGSFNGNNKTISGMKIKMNDIEVFSYNGLFGYVEIHNGYNCSFINVILSAEDGSSIELSRAEGEYHVGSLIGYMENRSVNNACAIEACVSNISSNLSFTKGAVSVGGLIGSGFGFLYMNGCVNNGKIDAIALIVNLGGLVGQAGGSNDLTACRNSGMLSGKGNSVNSGGIIGESSAKTTFRDCSNSGVITTGGSTTYVGGMIGYGFGGGDRELIKCVNSANFYGKGSTVVLGGIIGIAELAAKLNIKSCENSGNFIGEGNSTYIGGMVSVCGAQLTLEKSVNSGNISDKSSLKSYHGGMIALCESMKSTIIRGCLNSGTIRSRGIDEICSGGIIGQNKNNEPASIEYCVNQGDIKGAQSTSTSIGGIEGKGFCVLNVVCCMNGGDLSTTGADACVGGLLGNETKLMHLNNSYSFSTIVASGRGYAGGLIGKTATNDMQTQIYMCFAAGSIASAEGSKTGGIIGCIETPIVEKIIVIGGCVAMLSSAPEKGFSRITEKSNNQIQLSSNYAYVSNYSVEEPDAMNADGADWSGNMEENPISNWFEFDYWELSDSPLLMPKITGLREKNIDVLNIARAVYVSFDSGGGSAVDTQIIEKGTYAESPKDPTRKGYDFVGWFTEPEGGEYWDFEFNEVEESMTLYAQWIRLYTYYLDAQDGSAPWRQVVPEGTGFGLIENLTRDGYRFLGWFDQPKGGNRYNPPMIWVTKNTYVYGQWIKLHTITFDPQGGSGIASQVLDDQTIATKPADPKRDGYGLLGWFTSPDGDLPAWNFNSPITGNMTLYARWQPLLSGDFISVDMIPTQVYTGKPLTPAVTIRHGNKLLELNVDYTVSYEDNDKIGTGCTIITGKGSYGGVRRIYFLILAPTEVVSLTIETSEQVTTIPGAGLYWYQRGLRPTIELVLNDGFSWREVFVYLNDKLIIDPRIRSVEVDENGANPIIKLDPLMENAVLRIGEYDPSSVTAVADSEFKVSVVQQGIQINTSRASTVQIVRLNGGVEVMCALPVGETTIGLTPGSYIVRIEDSVWKVLITK